MALPGELLSVEEQPRAHHLMSPPPGVGGETRGGEVVEVCRHLNSRWVVVPMARQSRSGSESQ